MMSWASCVCSVAVHCVCSGHAACAVRQHDSLCSALEWHLEDARALACPFPSIVNRRWRWCAEGAPTPYRTQGIQHILLCYNCCCCCCYICIIIAAPPLRSRGPLSGRPMPAATSASTWLWGRGVLSSNLTLWVAGRADSGPWGSGCVEGVALRSTQQGGGRGCRAKNGGGGPAAASPAALHSSIATTHLRLCGLVPSWSTSAAAFWK